MSSVRSGLDDFDPLNVPRVAREVDRITDQVTPWAKDLPPGVNPSRVSSVSGATPADVRTLFEGRTRLAKLRTSSDPGGSSGGEVGGGEVRPVD